MKEPKKFYRKNRELMLVGEFYSRAFLFDVYNNDLLRKKHHSISDKEWETFMFDFESLVEELRVHLMEVIVYSCMCEFRHFGTEFYTNNESEKRETIINRFIDGIDEDHRYKFTCYKTTALTEDARRLLKNRTRFCLCYNGYRRSRSVKILEKLFDKSEMFDLMSIISKAFNDYRWVSGYGGKKWGMGTQGWFRLNSAKTLQQKIVAIDHAYDLQHNSGLLFNKDRRYESIEYSLGAVLTRKRYAVNLFEILHIPKSGSNQFQKRFYISCFPRSYKEFLKIGFKMGI